jgi:hypothetical protein
MAAQLSDPESGIRLRSTTEPGLQVIPPTM